MPKWPQVQLKSEGHKIQEQYIAAMKKADHEDYDDLTKFIDDCISHEEWLLVMGDLTIRCSRRKQCAAELKRYSLFQPVIFKFLIDKNWWVAGVINDYQKKATVTKQ